MGLCVTLLEIFERSLVHKQKLCFLLCIVYTRHFPLPFKKVKLIQCNVLQQGKND